MKKILGICFGLSLILFSAGAWSDEPASAAEVPSGATLSPAAADPTPTPKPLSQACEDILTACTGAGFTKGGDQGHDILSDCVKPIITGKAVSNVTIDPSEVSDCKKYNAAPNQKGTPSPNSPPGKPILYAPTPPPVTQSVALPAH